MARFAGGKAPFLRSVDQGGQNTKKIMVDFLIGLLPVILFAWYKNGIQVYINGDCSFLEMLYPLVFILLGGLISVLMEGLVFVITDKETRTLKAIGKKLSLSFSAIPGLILALILPMYTPIWVLIFGCFMGTVVGKMLFGGFGHNIFNPALVGYLAIGFTFSGLIASSGGNLNPSEVLVDSYAGATPLGTLAMFKTISWDTLVAPYGTLWNFFLGTIPGSLGETSALIILVSFIWLSVRKVIKWSTPVIYVGTVFLLSWLIGTISGDSGLWFPTYSILSGGLMFGAVFMATEPVTAPKNPLGKIVYALFLGVLTVLFRMVGNFPEGVATSIIVMNIFTIPVDQVTAEIRANGITKKTWVKALVILLIILGIGFYAVTKSVKTYTILSSFLGGVM